MTAPIPEQMRALADDLNDVSVSANADIETILSAEAALRAAADQLEAVQALLPPPRTWAESLQRDITGKPFPWLIDADAIRVILTADTAPQEDPDV